MSLAGGYTPFRPLDFLEQKIFTDIYDKLDGVGYVPYAVSSQVVGEAVNYRFLCTQTIITKDPITNIVIVEVKGSDINMITLETNN